jgi:hypothetical protein
MTDISKKNVRRSPQKCPQTTSDFEKLKDNWPSPFVARSRIAEFTQGMFRPDSINTMDARGDGITPRYSRGAKIFYEVDSVISWLETRIKNKKGRST